MKLKHDRLNLNTKGPGDLVDITTQVQEFLTKTSMVKGVVNVFVRGSTAAITTFEYEPGMITDMQALYERLAPAENHYLHNETWNDANGFSHVRAALQGPSLSVPFEKSKMLLGTWQQIVLAEFDTRPRQREVVLSFLGE